MTEKNPHLIHETRSLAMHRIVSKLLSESPETVRRFGLDNIRRWKKQGVDCEDFGIWEKLLLQNQSDLTTILESGSPEAVRLRQSSPFAGLVPQVDRLQILKSIS